MAVRLLIAAFIFIASGLVLPPAHAMTWPQEPTLKARSWVLMDARSGQILGSHEENLQLPPASLTKMMTLYLVFEDISLGRLDPEEKVQVSNKAWKKGGSRMFIEPRLSPTVSELLHGISTLSGNDASIALAEHISGSEEAFVERMNAKARELGLAHTNFANSTGFPEKGHQSSALDMARLGTALWRDFPNKFKLFSERQYTYNGIRQSNRNRLLWSDPRINGIKTGHTEKAGYCLVASAQKGETRLVAAVFGTDSEAKREQQTRLLLNFGFRNFVSVRPAQRQIRRQVEVFKGKDNQVWLAPLHPVWITVPKGYERFVIFRLRYSAPLLAPVRKGQRVGMIEAVLQDRNRPAHVLAKANMLATNAVARASWFGRQWDALRLWWRDSNTQTQP